MSFSSGVNHKIQTAFMVRFGIRSSVVVPRPLEVVTTAIKNIALVPQWFDCQLLIGPLVSP
jgi:hypothetical protein